MILHLVDKEVSEIKYTINKFPDGQQSIELDCDRRLALSYEYIRIISRLNNFSDLELIICAVRAVKHVAKNAKICLHSPYFLGGRSDRRFSDWGINYLKEVICPIINSLELSNVSVMDPHSYSLEMGLNNFHELSCHYFYDFVREQVYGKDLIIICPDAGAAKRAQAAAKQIGITEPIITCEKIRDRDGKIIKTSVPHFDLSKSILIVDDICDGGKTFTEIASVIKLRHEQSKRDHESNACGKLYLAVTHGIFSKGLGELSDYFDNIFCTNSYKDIDNSLMFGAKSRDFVRQFKII